MKTAKEILNTFTDAKQNDFGESFIWKDEAELVMKEYAKSILDHIVNSDEQYVIGKDGESLFDYTEIEKLKEQLQ